LGLKFIALDLSCQAKTCQVRIYTVEDTLKEQYEFALRNLTN